MTRETVAAIVPVYNNRDTVEEAIDSVLAQTRPADEIVVVDDGSTDGSADFVAARYGERVRLIRQANGGPSAARNAGIRASRSSLIAFLDGDDRWLPCKLERQAAFMEAQPSCMLSFSASLIWHEYTGETRTENTQIDPLRFLHRDFFQERIHIATDAVMVRREAFEQVGLFDESLHQCEDADMWLRIMVRYGFEHIPEPLVWVRRTVGYRQVLGGHQDDNNFKVVERYFAKHRNTFSGLRGWAIWRAGYASVLRRQAGLCLRAGRRWMALRLLLKGIFIWPFVAFRQTTECAFRVLFGDRAFRRLVSVIKFLSGRSADKRMSGP